jgi:hypothetical protein
MLIKSAASFIRAVTWRVTEPESRVKSRVVAGESESSPSQCAIETRVESQVTKT